MKAAPLPKNQKIAIIAALAALALVMWANVASADIIPTPVTDISAHQASTTGTASVTIELTSPIQAAVSSISATFSNTTSGRYLCPSIQKPTTYDYYLPYTNSSCNVLLKIPLLTDGLPHQYEADFAWYKHNGICSPAPLIVDEGAGSFYMHWFLSDSACSNGYTGALIYGSANQQSSLISAAPERWLPVVSPAWNINYTPEDATRIISVTPAEGEATSTPALSVTYAANASDTIPIDTVSISVYSLTGGLNVLYSSTTPAVLGATTTIAYTTLGFTQGIYSTQVILSNSANFGANVATTTTWSIGAASSTWVALIGATSTNQDDLNFLATSTCDILNLAGCFQNALVWAFVPSTSSVQYIVDKRNAMAAVKPFGYITLSYNAIANATTTGASTTLNFYALVPTSTALYAYTVSPLRSGLLMLVWIGCLFGIFHNFRHRTF